MSQYQFKKRSGHANPKHGGECEPITSCTMTHWLAFTPFWIALLYTIVFAMASLFSSAVDICSNTTADCVHTDISLPSDTEAGPVFSSWGCTSGTLKLLNLQVRSRLSGTFRILRDVHKFLYEFLPTIPWYLGTLQDDCTNTFHYWVKPFHWNFVQYLPAYLKWREHVDSTTHQCYPDATCGSFEVKEMISWRLRRMIRRVTERIQRKLAQIHSMLDPMMPLPPPEPPPTWDNGWPWDVEPSWYYTILEPTDESFEDLLEVESPEEVTRLADWK